MLSAVLPALTWQLISRFIERAREERRRAAILAKRIRVPNPTRPDAFAARRALSQLNWTSGSRLVA